MIRLKPIDDIIIIAIAFVVLKHGIEGTNISAMLGWATALVWVIRYRNKK